MKIHVIDNAGQIPPLLLMAEPEVAFYADEVLALNAAEQFQPELILLNYTVRGQETADYIDLLLAVSPASSLVVIGDDLGDDTVLICLSAGAKGYQDSRELERYLGKMIQAIKAEEAWISRRMTSLLLDFIRQHSAAHQSQTRMSVFSLPESVSKLQ